MIRHRPRLCILVALACSLAGPVNAEESVIVSPNGLGDKEGNSWGRGPTFATRVQYLYPSSDFADLPDSNRHLAAIAWRPDETTNALTTSTDSFTVRVSTSPAVDRLSHTFADNIGEDEIVVFDGPATISTSAEARPRGFDFRVDFDELFHYDPGRGNLLVEFATSGFDVGNWSVDNEDFFGDEELLIQTTRDDPDADVAGWTGNLLAVTEFTFVPEPLTGDFNMNGELDAGDIDLLSAEVRGGLHRKWFDLNDDASVDEDDHEMWVHELKNTWIGDADLNGEFDSSDMVQVFAEGKYETGQDAGWAKGDWDCTGVFDSSDMVAAFADGGYENGLRPAAAAVPEPTSAILLLGSLIVVANRRRRLDL